MSGASLMDLGSPARSDAQKLRDFRDQFPSAQALPQPICDMADRLDHDQEAEGSFAAILS